MNKLNSYLGLFVTIFIGLFVFYPKYQALHEGQSSISLLDSDEISHYIRQHSESSKLLFRAERYMHLCPNGPTEPYTFECGFYNYGFDINDLSPYKHEIDKYSPGFSKANDDYWSSNDFSTEKMLTLQNRAIEVYPKLHSRFRTNYVLLTSVAHIGFLLLLTVLIWWRLHIGSFLVSLVIVPSKLIIKGASEVHRKI